MFVPPRNERLGLDHWISRDGGVLLPRWSTLPTSWMTRSCPWLTTGAKNRKCIMTTTTITTVSTISLIIIMPCSGRLSPAQVTQIARSPARNGSPWFTQVFHRWWCRVTFHQALLSLHSALGLKNIRKMRQFRGISFQMDCFAAFLGVWESGNVRAARSGTMRLRFFYAKGANEYWNGQAAQTCETMTPFTALHWPRSLGVKLPRAVLNSAFLLVGWGT